MFHHISVVTCVGSRALHTSPTLEGKRVQAAIRGFWYTGKTKKGGKCPPAADVVDGRIIWDKKLRYSYGGKDKYEYEKWDQVNPHFGEFDNSSSFGPHQVYLYKTYLRKTGTPAISLHVQDPSILAKQYYSRIENSNKQLGSNQDNHPVRRWWPYSGNFFNAHEFRLMEKMALTPKASKQETFDTLAEAYFLVKLSQKASEMRGEREEEGKLPEMRAKFILRRAIKNTSPGVKIDFVESGAGTFHPCPVPLTSSGGTSVAIRRLKILSKKRKRNSPVVPDLLAENILDAYYERGPIYELVKEDTELGTKNKDAYTRFSKVSSNASERYMGWKTERAHLWHQSTMLPLANEEYGRSPGQPEWNDMDQLDREDL